MKPKLLILLTSLCLGLSSCSQPTENPRFREIIRPYKTISPLIRDLLKKENNILQAEMNKFWRMANENGLPLVEEDLLDPDYKFVTLVYRDSTHQYDISFEVFGTYDETRLGDKKLRQLVNTDLYYRCYKFPEDICFSYRFILKDKVSGEEVQAPDKYNPDRIPRGEARSYSYSVFDFRKHEADWNAKKYENLKSWIDTISYTDRIVDKSRNIYVYLPPGYDKDRKEPYPVIYLFDAFIYLNRVELPNILDNMITEGKTEPLIAVLISTYRSSRDIILPVNFDFKDDFISRLVPMIRKNYNSSLAPGKNIIGGMSYGGLAGAFIAWYHPDIFGKVLSQSGSFWRGLKLTDDQGKWIREDWIINKFLAEDKKNLKLYLDWGLQENWVLEGNRRMVRVLKENAYDHKFIEFNGWHDWSNSRKTFPVGLKYLLD